MSTLTCLSSPASWCLSHRVQSVLRLFRGLSHCSACGSLRKLMLLLLKLVGGVAHEAPVEAVAAQVTSEEAERADAVCRGLHRLVR